MGLAHHKSSGHLRKLYCSSKQPWNTQKGPTPLPSSHNVDEKQLLWLTFQRRWCEYIWREYQSPIITKDKHTVPGVVGSGLKVCVDWWGLSHKEGLPPSPCYGSRPPTPYLSPHPSWGSLLPEAVVLQINTGAFKKKKVFCYSIKK